MAPAFAAPTLPCSGPEKDQIEVACGDKELVALAKAVDARLDRLLGTADPLSAMLLRRDQRWFTEVLGAQYASAFQGRNDPERKRMQAALQRRSALLGGLRVGAAPDGVTGQWANALATIKVAPLARGAVRIEVAAKIAYAGDYKPVTCALSATLAPAGDGWYAAPTRADKPAAHKGQDAEPVRPDQAPAAEREGSIRLRRQG